MVRAVAVFAFFLLTSSVVRAEDDPWTGQWVFPKINGVPLRDEESVLVVPGDHFGMDGYLRLGAGEDAAYVLAGLERLKAFLDRLAAVPAP